MNITLKLAAVGGIGAVLLGVPAWGGAASREAAPAGGPVALRAAAIEIAPVSALAFEVLVRELQSLLDATGVRVDWRRVRPAGETRIDELRVVFLDAPGRGAHAGRPILGASGQAGPAPTIWVYMPTVVAALNLPTDTPLQTFVAQRAMGVALGHVLAHEMVHLLAPEVPHSTGVMAARFRLAGLRSGQASLDAESADALAHAARAWRIRGGPPSEEERRARARRATVGGTSGTVGR